MEMTIVTALRRVVVALENDTVSYRWKDMGSCNFGILAQVVLDMNYDFLVHVLRKEWDKLGVPPKRSWEKMVQMTCKGMSSSSDLIKDLIAEGFAPEDIVSTEKLSNPIILKEAGIWVNIFNKRTYYRSKKNAIRYFNAWVRILHGENKNLTTKRSILEAQLIIATRRGDYGRCKALIEQLLTVS